MQIGILALQGAFIEHANMLKALNVDAFYIRQVKDLHRPMDGLILPGGESTTMFKLLRDLEMIDILKEKIQAGLPILGTCAGLLLLAKKVTNHSNPYLQTMNITAKKNAYGRQLGSFRVNATFAGKEDIPFVFIRAPYIEEVGSDVTVLATVEGKIVAAQEGNQLVTAFHPELTKDTTVHEYFLTMCQKAMS